MESGRPQEIGHALRCVVRHGLERVDHRRETGELIGVADPIKESTPPAIQALHDEGIRVVMPTGDNRTTAEAVAKELGIDEVVAEVRPDQHADAVKRLQDEGRVVAIAGDGIDDAPALALNRCRWRN